MLRNLRKMAYDFFTSKGGEEGMVARFKAHVVGGGLETNVIAPDDAATKQFGESGALSPPLPFDQLLMLFFTSNSLRQNVDAMGTNVHGFGWRPVLTLPGLFNAEGWKVVQEFERMRGIDLDDEAAKVQWDAWKKEAETERHRLTHLIEHLNPEDTFTELRLKMSQDREVLGNGAWEWVRDRKDDLKMATHVPFVSLRMLPLDTESIEVDVPHKTDPVTIENVKMRKRFRRFVQVQDQLTVFFKELGDPRLISSKSGTVFETPEQMEFAEPGSVPATELLVFKVYAPNEAYGMARYVGAMPEIIGSRMAAEVNVLYFENKSVPPLIMTVSGGRVAADSVGRIESFIKNNIKGGGENFHNILIIEAESDGDSKAQGQAKIKVQPLTDAINQDALFQKYDRNNIDKVGATFRMPGMLTGSTRELNRATADVAKALAEEQVFQPERDKFDAIMNRQILPRLGVRFWEFKTRQPITRDPQVLSQILARLVENAIVMPGEARELVPEILGRDLDPCDEDFLKRPLRLTLAMQRSGDRKGQGDGKPGDPPPDGGVLGTGQSDEDLDAQIARLFPVAKDAAMVRQLVEAIEMKEDIGSLDAKSLRALIAGDGSVDSETPSPVAPPA